MEFVFDGPATGPVVDGRLVRGVSFDDASATGGNSTAPAKGALLTQQQAVDAETIKMLTRENALLRQQAANATTASFHARLRGRASTAGGYGMGNGYGLHESVPEESDFAIEELEETADAGELAAKRAAIGRRMSEFGAGTNFRSPFPVENRKLPNTLL